MDPPSDSRLRALVTGHDGFTGYYVTRELERAGYEVIGLSRSGPGDAGLVVADLMDPEALAHAIDAARADVVVHLAAISFVAHGNAEAIYAVNVVGTRNLLAALAGAKKQPSIVIVAGSANIYGNSTAGVINEDVAPAPVNDYGVSKVAMEYVARLWMDRLPITITRPFNYTGVGQGQQFLIPKIVSHFRRGLREIELGNVHVWRDFSDVRNVAFAYSRLVEASPVGNVFNICSGEAYSLEEVLALMETVAGYRINVRVNPDFVRANEVERLVGDCSHLQDCIGPMPRVPLLDTLRWMYSGSNE